MNPERNLEEFLFQLQRLEEEGKNTKVLQEEVWERIKEETEKNVDKSEKKMGVKELEATCVVCGERIKTPFWKEAQKTRQVGCQACRLAKTLDGVSPQVEDAIWDFMERSGQKEILEKAHARRKKDSNPI